jgi:hypothetical protein
VDDGRLLALATNPQSYPYHPANVRLYDVTDDQQWHWIGAVTLGKDPIDGMIRRLVLRGTRLYALVSGQGKGLHVIDLPTARDLFAEKTNGEEGTGLFDLMQSLGTEGRGFGETAIVQSVFIPTDGTGLNSLMHDLAVTELTVDGIAQPIAVATGRSPLAVVNPQTGVVLYNGPILDQTGASLTSWGYAVEAGAVNGTPIALVSAVRALGGADHVFVVVDLTDPSNPRALSALSLPGNPAAVQDILLQGTMAYVGTDSGTHLISLADLTQPRLVSTVTSVGGRLALTDANLLFGTMRSAATLQHELGGVRSASLSSIAIIQKITPAIVQVDEYGNTTEPIRVTYRLFGALEDLHHVNLALRRDDERISSRPGPAIEQGAYDVEFPAGLPLRPPSETIKVSIPTADGPGEGVVTYVQSAADAGRAAVIAATPSFGRLLPAEAPRGSSVVSVRVEGTNVGGLRTVFLRHAAGATPSEIEDDNPAEWLTAQVTSAGPTWISFDMPSAILAKDGFVHVAPIPAPEEAVAFAVSIPDLPAVGSAPHMPLIAVEPADITRPGASLRMTGAGFHHGVTVVLGRAGRVAMRLDTYIEDENTLEVFAPSEYLGAADDLYVAVLAADGAGLSDSKPVASRIVHDPSSVPEGVDPTQPAILSMRGPVIWNANAQELTLEGVAIADGAQIALTSDGRTFYQVATGAAPGLGGVNQVATVKVKVPDALTDWPDYCVSLELDVPTIATQVRCLGVQRPAQIPIGGRRKFVTYAGPDERLYILHEPDPESRVAPGQCAPRPKPSSSPSPSSSPVTGPRSLPAAAPAQVTFSVTIPDIQHPFSDPTYPLDPLPLFEREYNRCDPDNPDVLYLRGIRFNQPGERVQVRASFTDPTSGRRKTGVLHVEVAPAELGTNGNLRPERRVPADFDAAFNDAAGRAGVPPQFLKAQSFIETRNNPEKFRYEPATIDFNAISSDVAGSRTNTYVKRHLLAGTAVAAPTQPVRPCVALLGPGAPEDPAPQVCIPIDGRQAHQNPVSFTGAAVRVRGRVELPIAAGKFNPNWRRPPITATIVDPSGGPTLDRVEPSFYSLAETQRNSPRTGEYQLDFLRNTILLGQPLGQGQWLRLEYEVLQGEAVQGGSCGLAFNVTTLTGKTDMPNRDPVTRQGIAFTFQPGDSIAGWLARNLNDQRGYNWLNGTDSEKRIEFAVDASGRRTPNVLDRRFELATAQFVAAGSWGLFHATILDWLDTDKAAVLNQAFNLNDRCLTELMTNRQTRLRTASELVAASHSWAVRQVGVPACDAPGRCDQVDWARRWARVTNRYNTRDARYKLTGGFNDVVRDGVSLYDAR